MSFSASKRLVNASCVVLALFMAVMVSCTAALADEDPDELRKRVYIFRGLADYPPYEFLDGTEPAGFNVELLKAIARVMELNIRIELGTKAEALEAFDSAEIDGFTSFVFSVPPKNSKLLSIPFGRYNYALFTRRKEGIKNLADLRDGVLIVPHEDVAFDHISPEGFSGTLVQAATPADVLRRLAAGYGDGALVEHRQGLLLCEELGLSHLTVSESNLIPFPYSYAVSRENEWLYEQINEGLRILMLSGEFSGMLFHWILGHSASSFALPLKNFLFVLGTILVLAAVGGMWVGLLRREVHRRTEALQESQERYRALFEHSSDALFLLCDTVHDCNQRACELLGAERNDILGLTPADFSPKFQQDGRTSVIAARAYIDAAMSGEPQLFNWIHTKKNGDLVEVEVSLREIIGFAEPMCMAAVRDLSERREAERVVRREQDLVRAITQTSPVGIVTLNAAGKIIFANPRAERILRLNRSELYGRRYNDVRWHITDLHGAPYPEELLPFRQVVQSEKPVYDSRHMINHADGVRTVLSMNAAPLFDESGALSDVVVTVEDITAQFEEDRERELRWGRIERQQNAIIQIARDEAMALGNFDDISNLIAARATEVLEVHVTSVWLFDEARTGLVCKAKHGLRGGDELSVETLDIALIPGYINALETGRHVDVADAHRDPRTVQLLENYLIPNEVGALLDAPIRIGGKLMGVVCNEFHGGVRYWRPDELHFAAELADQAAQALVVHDRRLLENRMQQAQKLESLGILAGGLAHDFNNLLTAIIGNVDLAQMDVPVDNPAVSALREIKTLSARAADLCRSMLAYAGKGKMVVRPVNLNEEIREIGRIICASIAGNVRLVYEMESDLPPVEADRGQIQQVIMNLILNASEAIGPAEGVITVRTFIAECDNAFIQEAFTTEALAEGPYVAVEVSDTGCGMDGEVLEKIFNPFFSTKFVGRGMGLSAVLGIVQGHKGGIRVQSTPGDGAVFTVLLPVCDSPCEISGGQKEIEQFHQNSGCVLLVDANPASRRITGRILTRLGFSVAYAADLKEAENNIRHGSDRVQCVYIDHALNQRLKEEEIKVLKGTWPDIPLVLATDLEEQEAAQCFGKWGFRLFIHKPARVATLAAKLRLLLGE